MITKPTAYLDAIMAMGLGMFHYTPMNQCKFCNLSIAKPNVYCDSICEKLDINRRSRHEEHAIKADPNVAG